MAMDELDPTEPDQVHLLPEWDPDVQIPHPWNVDVDDAGIVEWTAPDLFPEMENQLQRDDIPDESDSIEVDLWNYLDVFPRKLTRCRAGN